MKKIFAVLLLAVMVFSFSACGNNSFKSENPSATSTPASDNNNNSEKSETGANTNTKSDLKILVAFFSHTGENYGVGVIEKGNTHIIADMIADEMGADTFEIARVNPYPTDYDGCTQEAKQEQNDKARPELTAKVDNFNDYDVIFLGYPNWWGDMPMPVYTFLESYDFSGKTVIPFCTHAGSGLSSTEKTLKNKFTNSTVLKGLAVAGTTAQKNQSEAQKAVTDWLNTLNVKK